MAELKPNGGDNAQTRTGESDIRGVIENANNAADDNTDDNDTDQDDDAGDDDDDSSNGDGNGSGDGSDSDDDDSDDSDDGDDDDDSDDDAGDKGKPDKKSQVDRKYDQFKGDGTDTAYISNLEKGYQSSSAEAIRLKGELDTASARVDAIMRAAAQDPDLATKLNAAMNDAGGSDGDGNSDSQAAVSPFVRNLQAEWQEKSQKEIEAFIDANPEVSTDPQIEADVKHWMGVFSNDAYQRTGKLMSGGEAMALAYKHLGLENKLEKQNLADGAKKNAAPARQRGKSKKGGSQKATFTPEQIAMAQAMGKDEAWLQSNAK